MKHFSNLPTTYFLLMVTLCFSLVGCSSATTESYNQELREFIDGFQGIQSDLSTTSGAFSKDYTDAEATKALQNTLKEVSSYIRKAEKLKAPSQLEEAQSNLSSSASGTADSIDNLVKVLGIGITEATLTDFSKLFTEFNDNLTSFSKTLYTALGQSTPAG